MPNDSCDVNCILGARVCTARLQPVSSWMCLTAAHGKLPPEADPGVRLPVLPPRSGEELHGVHDGPRHKPMTVQVAEGIPGRCARGARGGHDHQGDRRREGCRCPALDHRPAAGPSGFFARPAVLCGLQDSRSRHRGLQRAQPRLPRTAGTMECLQPTAATSALSWAPRRVAHG